MNRDTIVLRKIRGVFDACRLSAGMPRFAGIGRAPSMLSTVGAFCFALMVPLLLIATFAIFVTALTGGPSHLASLFPAGVVLATGGTVTDRPVKDMLDDLNRAFKEFQNKNDERIQQLEKRGSADGQLVSDVEKINNRISELTRDIENAQKTARDAETAAARVAPAGSPEAAEREMKNATSFFAQVRGVKGSELVVSDSDIKAYREYGKAFDQYLRRGPQAFNDAQIRAALQTGQAPNGGLWLTPEYQGKILEFIRAQSPIRELATVASISTDTYEGYYDFDEADSGWVGEISARPETNTPQVPGKYTIPVFEQYANPKSTQKMLDDAEFDVENWLAAKVAAKLARRENPAFVAGDGINKPRGFTTYPSGVPAATSPDAYRVIEQIKTGTNGAWGTNSNATDKLIDTVMALDASLRSGAQWAMTTLTLASVRKLKDGQNNYLLVPDFSQGFSGSLLGYGVKEVADMQEFSVGAGALVAAFANWKEAYRILDHTVGTRVLRDPYTGKPYVSYYTTKRVGGDVENFQAIKLVTASA